MTSHGETVLVAEHDQAVRRLVCGALATDGYRIVQAGSAEEAVRAAARHTPEIDLLLTEAKLPNLAGWELADLLKLDYPNLKVVYISDDDGAIVRAHTRQAGVVVPVNPFRGEPLREAVHAALDVEAEPVESGPRAFLSQVRRWLRPQR